MLHGDLSQFNEAPAEGQFTKQNGKLLKVSLAYGPVMARLGSMVAYQGDATFDYAGSGGAGKWLKQKVSGEGLPLMTVGGQGEVFLAAEAQDVHVFYLENDSITCNGWNLLAFSSSLSWDIVRVQSTSGMITGGLWNTALTGTGYVGVITDGPPVLLDVSAAPTFADPQAAVIWSSGVQTQVQADINLGALIGRGSGENFQVAYSGQGWVLVQPSEAKPVTAQQKTSGGQGIASSLFGQR